MIPAPAMTLRGLDAFLLLGHHLLCLLQLSVPAAGGGTLYFRRSCGLHWGYGRGYGGVWGGGGCEGSLGIHGGCGGEDVHRYGLDCWRRSTLISRAGNGH
jgi:hypothetical protein